MVGQALLPAEAGGEPGWVLKRRQCLSLQSVYPSKLSLLQPCNQFNAFIMSYSTRSKQVIRVTDPGSFVFYIVTKLGSVGYRPLAVASYSGSESVNIQGTNLVKACSRVLKTLQQPANQAAITVEISSASEYYFFGNSSAVS
jgi:hypothetical protein